MTPAPDAPLAVFVTTDASSAEFFRGQLRGLAQAGMRVVLVASPGSGTNQGSAAALAASEGADFYEIPMSRSIALWADLRAVVALVQLFRKLKPTLVDGSTPKAGLLAMVACVFAGVGGARIRHHTLRGIRHTTLRGPKRWLTYAAQWLTCRLAKQTLAISASLAEQAVRQRLVAAADVKVLGAGSSHGVDLAYFDPTRHAPAGEVFRDCWVGDAPSPFVVGYIGRIARDKGIAVLADAWRQLAADGRYHLAIIGDMDRTDPVDTATWQALRALPRVTYLPHQREIGSIYAALDLLVLPSLREGFGNVLIEAGAMTLPVIASDIVGCRDAVIAGETGTLVRPGAADELARAIAVYAHSPQQCVRHAAGGRARAMAAFNAVHSRERWVAYMAQLCGWRTPPSTAIAIDRDLPLHEN